MSYGADNTELLMMARLWAQGLDTLEIAKRCNCREAHVYNRIETIKVTARRTFNPRTPERAPATDR